MGKEDPCKLGVRWPPHSGAALSLAVTLLFGCHPIGAETLFAILRPQIDNPIVVKGGGTNCCINCPIGDNGALVISGGKNRQIQQACFAPEHITTSVDCEIVFVGALFGLPLNDDAWGCPTHAAINKLGLSMAVSAITTFSEGIERDGAPDTGNWR